MVKTNREGNRRLSDPVHKGQSARTAYEGGEPLGRVEIQQTWKFVDRANHGCLMAAMARARADKRMMKLIRAFLETGGSWRWLSESGAGSLLSPLRSDL